MRPVNRANGHNYDDRSNKLIASYMHRIIKISLFLPRDAMQSAPYEYRIGERTETSVTSPSFHYVITGVGR